jgi:hypothetical protein
MSALVQNRIPFNLVRNHICHWQQTQTRTTCILIDAVFSSRAIDSAYLHMVIRRHHPGDRPESEARKSPVLQAIAEPSQSNSSDATSEIDGVMMNSSTFLAQVLPNILSSVFGPWAEGLCSPQVLATKDFVPGLTMCLPLIWRKRAGWHGSSRGATPPRSVTHRSPNRAIPPFSSGPSDSSSPRVFRIDALLFRCSCC